MNRTVTILTSIIGPCPTCGGSQFKAVCDGELTNILCPNCGTCWHAELGWVHRVNPATCPGCPSHDICEASRPQYGERIEASG